MRLENKVALITGGGSGIGEATAHKLAQEGAAIFITDFPGTRAKQVCDVIIANGGQAAFFYGDISEEKDAIACVADAVSAYCQLDILVSNNGSHPFSGEIDSWNVKEFDNLVKMNCKPGFLMTKYALPFLKKTNGNIVFIGSSAGISGSTQFFPYAASYGLVVALMKYVAHEQGVNGVRANAIDPGAVVMSADTFGNIKKMNREPENQVDRERLVKQQEIIEEITKVIAFVASDEAINVTGSTFNYDPELIASKWIIDNDD